MMNTLSFFVSLGRRRFLSDAIHALRLAVPLLVVTVAMTGCRSDPVGDLAADAPASVASNALTIARVVHPPTLAPDDVWSDVARHALTLSKATRARGDRLLEGGAVRWLYDDESLFLRFDLIDRDVTTLAVEGDDDLYRRGDLAEWFIGVASRVGDRPGVYLELHMAPNGVGRAYRVRRPGQVEPLGALPFTAEVHVDGTLNDPSDVDRGWSVQMALSRAALVELTAAGDAASGALPRWSVLAGRYNYGVSLPYGREGSAGPELTMWPTQPRNQFHLRPLHADVFLAD